MRGSRLFIEAPAARMPSSLAFRIRKAKQLTSDNVDVDPGDWATSQFSVAPSANDDDDACCTEPVYAASSAKVTAAQVRGAMRTSADTVGAGL